MPYCPNCGAEVAESAKFCPACGSQLQKLRPAVKAPSPTRVRRSFLLLVLLLCCCGLLFVVGNERGYFEPDQSSDGELRKGADTTPLPTATQERPSPDHAMTFDEAKAQSSRVDTLRAVEIARSYQPSHPYETDVFDCNDMAAELWEIYSEQGIEAYIVMGDLDTAGESFYQCKHAWLIVFCFDEVLQREDILAVEPTASYAAMVSPRYPRPVGMQNYTAEQIFRMLKIPGGASEQYLEGYYYETPSDMRADLGDWW